MKKNNPISETEGVRGDWEVKFNKEFKHSLRYETPGGLWVDLVPGVKYFIATLLQSHDARLKEELLKMKKNLSPVQYPGEWAAVSGYNQAIEEILNLIGEKGRDGK